MLLARVVVMTTAVDPTATRRAPVPPLVPRRPLPVRLRRRGTLATAVVVLVVTVVRVKVKATQVVKKADQKAPVYRQARTLTPLVGQLRKRLLYVQL